MGDDGEADAVIVSSSSSSSSGSSSTSADFTPDDGPSASIIGSVDKIFGSIKEYDQYRCIERMLCEYMQTTEEEEAEAGNLIDGVTAFLPSLTGFSRPPPTVRFRPPRRRPPPFRRRPRPPIRGRRRRQASSIPGNILRLLQVTGLNSLNAYPYVRAALIGQSSRPFTRVTRRRNTCSQMYRECPTDPTSIVDYLNNHNGGLINQVQPEVENEVAPIVSAIFSEALDGTRLFDPTASPAPSPGTDPLGITSLLDTGDTVLTQALIQGASGYLADGISSFASTLTGKK